MDTSRTFAELITLFANNTSGAISEQDQRDFVESVFSYGGMRMMLTDTPSGQSIGTDFVKMNQFTTNATSSNFIVPAVATDNITITKGGVFAVLIAISFSGSNNSTWQGTLFNNDVDTDKVQFKRKLSSSGDVGATALFDCITLVDDDVVDFRVKADAAAKTFTLDAGSFFLFRIG